MAHAIEPVQQKNLLLAPGKAFQRTKQIVKFLASRSDGFRCRRTVSVIKRLLLFDIGLTYLGGAEPIKRDGANGGYEDPGTAWFNITLL